MLQVLEDTKTWPATTTGWHSTTVPTFSFFLIVYVYCTYLMCTFSTCKLDKYFHVSVYYQFLHT